MYNQDVKFDKDKPEVLKVPYSVIKAYCEVKEYGERKYPSDAWRKVEPIRHINACIRHLFSIQNDLNKIDEESGIMHIKHALCDLIMATTLIIEDMDKVEIKKINKMYSANLPADYNLDN